MAAGGPGTSPETPVWEVLPHRGPGRPSPASVLLTSEENSSEQALSPQEPLSAWWPDLGSRKILHFTIPGPLRKKLLNAVKRTLISSFYFFRRNTAFLILKIAQVDGFFEYFEIQKNTLRKKLKISAISH